MANALDAFRAQRRAVDQLRWQVLEVAGLLKSLQGQVSAITRDGERAALVREERRWLHRLEDAMTQARRFRELEAQRFWPAVVRRWMVACAFSLAASAALGAGYVWAAQPFVEEMEALRRRAEQFDFVTERVIAMSPAERQQFDALMRGEGAR